MQESNMAKISINGQKKSTISLKSTNQEKPHLKILSDHKHIYDLFEKTGEMVNLHPHIRDEIVNAYRVENPHFHYNGNCGACIIEMMVTIYQWYNQQTSI